MARISVLMNVYNVGPYIAEALASVQSQTFSDIEIIVADDGSTDGTLRIVEQIASGDSRIRIVGTPENRGIPNALNLGLGICHAPFIAKMDGDDIALPTRLEKQLQFLEDHPGISLVGCATTAIDKLGKSIPGLGISRRPATQEDVAKTMLLSAPCLHVWLARREVYDKLSGYREMRFTEDYDFLLRAVTAGFQISNLSEALMKIRTRPGNVSSRIEQRKANRYIVRLFRERLKNGRDSFNREKYERSIKPGKVENFAFRLAILCAQKGVKSSSRIVCALWMVASAILSPWQARYFLDRVRFRFAMRDSRSVLMITQKQSGLRGGSL